MKRNNIYIYIYSCIYIYIHTYMYKNRRSIIYIICLAYFLEHMWAMVTRPVQGAFSFFLTLRFCLTSHSMCRIGTYHVVEHVSDDSIFHDFVLFGKVPRSSFVTVSVLVKLFTMYVYVVSATSKDEAEDETQKTNPQN